MFIMSGCGHNTDILTWGTKIHVGVDPQNITAAVTYSDGLNVSDVSRENSGWIIEVDSKVGLTQGDDGSIKGVKTIRRFVGPQMNGYLVDLAKTDPELARAYVDAMKAFWEFQLKSASK